VPVLGASLVITPGPEMLAGYVGGHWRAPDGDGAGTGDVADNGTVSWPGSLPEAMTRAAG